MILNPTIRHGLRSSLVAGALLATVSVPGRTQVITSDPSTQAQVALAVNELQQEVMQAQNIATTVGSVLNVQKDISGALGALGFGNLDIGGASVGDLIGSLQMGYQTVRQGVGQAEQIIQEVHNLSTDPLSSMSILTMLQAIFGSSATRIQSTNPNIATQLAAMNQLLAGTSSVPVSVAIVQQNMFTNAQSPTSEQIENVNATRRAVVQNAAIVSMTQAASAQQSIGTNGANAVQSLSQAVSNAQDERGDIKANSAILLKIVEQISAQNGLLAQLLYLESAQGMTTQGAYGPQAAPRGVIP
jgi:hypothetical protein